MITKIRRRRCLKCGCSAQLRTVREIVRSYDMIGGSNPEIRPAMMTRTGRGDNGAQHWRRTQKKKRDRKSTRPRWAYQERAVYRIFGDTAIRSPPSTKLCILHKSIKISKQRQSHKKVGPSRPRQGMPTIRSSLSTRFTTSVGTIMLDTLAQLNNTIEKMCGVAKSHRTDFSDIRQAEPHPARRI